jgi:hypothetical protein
MKQKMIPVFCLLGWMATKLNAQSNIVATGGNASGSGGSVSYSVGQIDYTSQKGITGSNLNEGVQQPYEIYITAVQNETNPAVNAKVFPNPTSDYIELSLNNANNEILYYGIYDLNGRLIEKKALNGNSARINMVSQPNGIYYLKVYSEIRMIKTFQVNKCS